MCFLALKKPNRTSQHCTMRWMIVLVLWRFLSSGDPSAPKATRCTINYVYNNSYIISIHSIGHQCTWRNPESRANKYNTTRKYCIIECPTVLVHWIAGQTPTGALNSTTPTGALNSRPASLKMYCLKMSWLESVLARNGWLDMGWVEREIMYRLEWWICHIQRKRKGSAHRDESSFHVIGWRDRQGIWPHHSWDALACLPFRI